MAVPKTSEAEIVKAARDLLEQDGVANVTMKNIGNAVGVRPSSLYKRFPDRASILLEVEISILADLTEEMVALPHDGAAEGLVAQANLFLRYAEQKPEAYRLLFTSNVKSDERVVEGRRNVLAMMMKNTQAIAGDERALSAARSIISFVHGYCMLRLENMFFLGGNERDAFDLGLRALLQGLPREKP